MSAVAQQHDRLGGDSLQDYVVFNRVTRVACAGYMSDDRLFAFQQSRWEKVTKFLSRNVWRSQSRVLQEMDEMCETASTIKTEVLAELNATRKRLHRIASDFVGCNTLTSQVSSYRSTFRAKVKSHTSCRKQPQTENDVSMACAKFLKAMKVNRTLLCERGKSDCRRRRSHANMRAFCQGNIGHVVGKRWQRGVVGQFVAL